MSKKWAWINLLAAVLFNAWVFTMFSSCMYGCAPSTKTIQIRTPGPGEINPSYVKEPIPLPAPMQRVLEERPHKAQILNEMWQMALEYQLTDVFGCPDLHLVEMSTGWSGPLQKYIYVCPDCGLGLHLRMLDRYTLAYEVVPSPAMLAYDRALKSEDPEEYCKHIDLGQLRSIVERCEGQ